MDINGVSSGKWIDDECSRKYLFACQKKLANKQGLVQDYTQRLIEGNINRQKLSRLKLFRLKLSRLKLSRLRPHRARLSRLGLCESEAGGGGGSGEIIYTSISRNKAWFKTIANDL